ncbi:DUF1918 domain-containing protein [Amycolatopsis kentuckyensis]|uniref:DUF1918 domain-containing protein n=1 Tax=Amycolatopsis kentuckyensis TaxID=218823 RepID=UPI000A3729D8|nr:DUF1918 domain-containing protein [Amycolatopsis kentuckyensis]
MHAPPGDWLVIKGPRVDAPEQRGRILEVRSADLDRVRQLIHEEDGHVRLR